MNSENPLRSLQLVAWGVAISFFLISCDSPIQVQNKDGTSLMLLLFHAEQMFAWYREAKAKKEKCFDEFIENEVLDVTAI